MDLYIVFVLVMLIPLAFLGFLLIRWIRWRARYDEKFKAGVRENVAKVAISVAIIVACVLLFIRMR